MSYEERIRILHWLAAWDQRESSALAQTADIAQYLEMDMERVNNICRAWSAKGCVLFADSHGDGSKGVCITPQGLEYIEDSVVKTEL